MDNRLKEIRERLGNITHGKWYAKQDLDNYGEYSDSFTVYRVPKPYSEKIIGSIYSNDECTDRANAEFIANSPTDIKYLLDALEQAKIKIKTSDSNLIDVCVKLQEAEDRERVLREALGKHLRRTTNG